MRTPTALHVATGALGLVFSHYAWLACATCCLSDAEAAGANKIDCPTYWRLIKDSGLCLASDDMGMRK